MVRAVHYIYSHLLCNIYGIVPFCGNQVSTVSYRDGTLALGTCCVISIAYCQFVANPVSKVSYRDGTIAIGTYCVMSIAYYCTTLWQNQYLGMAHLHWALLACSTQPKHFLAQQAQKDFV